jgi:hypothetical protein
MYNRKIAPIVSKIKKEIEDTIKISKSTLTSNYLGNKMVFPWPSQAEKT